MLKVQQYLLEKSKLMPSEEAIGLLEVERDIKTTFSPTGEPLVILNYNQIDNEGKHNPINMECRGLVLDYKNNFQVVAKAFNRFFNYEESPTVTRQFNWTNFSTVEKVDGSLILIYYYNNSWRVNSRGSFGDKSCGDWDKSWEEAVWSILDETAFDFVADKNCTYVCEICTPWNRVVTMYPNDTLFLLTVFNNKTLHEETAKDEIYDAGFTKPRSFDFHDVDDLSNKLSQWPDPLFEGFVVKDDKGMRLKLKAASYSNLHKLRGNNGQNLKDPYCILELILSHKDDDILAAMPEYIESFDFWRNVIKDNISILKNKYNSLKDIQVQKEFALGVNKDSHPLNWLLFNARKDGKGLLPHFWDEKNRNKVIEGLIKQKGG